jgi:hypothetical protein
MFLAPPKGIYKYLSYHSSIHQSGKIEREEKRR